MERIGEQEDFEAQASGHPVEIGVGLIAMGGDDLDVEAPVQTVGVVAIRAVDAQRILKEEFEIDCSLSSTYRLLHRIKLSWLAPRPRHPRADATAQAEFSQREIPTLMNLISIRS